MQLIEDGNYYIQIEYYDTSAPDRKIHCWQWEIAEISAGHIRWLRYIPARITIRELIEKNTPMVKIPAPEKLEKMIKVYRHLSESLNQDEKIS